MQQTEEEHTYAPSGRPRLLPWTEDGKPALLSTGDHGGVLSRLADTFEATHLADATDLLKEAKDAVNTSTMPNAALKHLVSRLTAALEGTLLIAKSRGLRLPGTDDDESEDA